jgi:hypothetical protein
MRQQGRYHAQRGAVEAPAQKVPPPWSVREYSSSGSTISCRCSPCCLQLVCLTCVWQKKNAQNHSCSENQEVLLWNIMWNLNVLRTFMKYNVKP